VDNPKYKELVWIGSTKEDLKRFPAEVRSVMGYALHVAQAGGKHPDTKPLKGFKGSGVLEVVEHYEGNSYRTVYTVRFRGTVYALHAFQKKSRKGITTPKADIDLINARLKRAKEFHERERKP
jgi:phage-related protein